MTCSCVRIGIKARQDLEAGALQPKRQAAAARKEIEDPGLAASLQPRNFGPGMVVSGRSEDGRLHSEDRLHLPADRQHARSTGGREAQRTYIEERRWALVCSSEKEA
jgi:hypothetical protein